MNSPPSETFSDFDLQTLTYVTMAERKPYSLAPPRGPKIPTFDGAFSTDALDFIQRFDELAMVYGWDDTEKLNRLSLYLKQTAASWFKQDIKPKIGNSDYSWTKLMADFKTTFLPSEYESFINQQLKNQKHHSQAMISELKSEYKINHIPPTRTNDNRPICYYCHKPGHHQVNCRSRLRDAELSAPQHRLVHPNQPHSAPIYIGPRPQQPARHYQQTHRPTYPPAQPYFQHPPPFQNHPSNYPYRYQYPYVPQPPPNQQFPIRNAVAPPPPNPNTPTSNVLTDCDENYLYIRCLVQNQRIKGLVDTGSTVSLIKYQFCNPEDIQFYQQGNLLNCPPQNFLKF
uniref:CCHC-type domain-containing protein n=1 Tax=Tetranychus urticae TaxID=32264 RepID=A0A158P522_TETUR